MAQSVNQAILIGRVGKDPDVKNFNGGGKLVTFSLATSKEWKDRQSGEKKTLTQWHTIAIWDTRLGDVAERSLRKGQMIYVRGAIENRKYTTKDGQDRYITEICLRPFDGELEILVNPAGSGQSSQNDWAPPQQPTRTDPKGNPIGGSTGNDLDDDIPFGPCVA